MAIVVQTNVASLIAQNSLTSATSSLNQAMERMSTGYKINSAKDDAAGLFVATSLEKNIRGSEIAKQNTQMGNDMLAVAEGDYVAIQDNLLRIRDLTLTAMNEVYDENSLNAIAEEIGARVDEITRSASTSQYNGLKLLNGDLEDGLRLQVGANVEAEDQIAITGVFSNATAGADGLNLSLATSADVLAEFAKPITDPDGGDTRDLETFAQSIDTALNTVQTARTKIGAYQNRLDSISSSLTTSIENLTSSKATIKDADIAAESTKFVSAQILQQASGALLVQANQAPQIALSLI